MKKTCYLRQKRRVLNDVEMISFPNVLIASHQGFFTCEAMQQIAETTFLNADAFETGSALINEVRRGAG